MKNLKKLLAFILITALVLSSAQVLAFAESEDGEEAAASVSSVTAWYCQLIGDQDAPVSDSSAVYNLTAGLNVDGGEVAAKAYIEEAAPYIYVTKNNKFYEKAYFSYDEEKGFAAAAMTLYGCGEFYGIVCDNENDGVAVSMNAEGTSFSTFSLSSFVGMMSTRISYKLDASAAEGLWQKYTGMPVFSDVSPLDWFYKSVAIAYRENLVKGKTSDSFAPDASMTYAEAITIAARLHAKYSGNELSTESKEGEPWYQPYLNYAYCNSIPCRFTDYSAEISRKDFVKIFYSTLPEENYEAINNIPDNAIPDVPYGSALSKKIYTFYRAGILSGTSTGAFLPDEKIKRSAVAAIVCRLIGYERQQFSLESEK